MSKIFNTFINPLKWPIAILLLLLMPSFVEIFENFNFFTIKSALFWGGALMFFGLSALFDREVKVSLQTLGHELTHAFFAVITFHKVKSVRVGDEGGYMSFEGKGNWLIVVAPYFFPLFLVFVIFALAIVNSIFPNNFLLGGYYPLLISFVLGFLTGAHLDMIGSQVHNEQTDFKMLGLLFCLIFIVPANVFVLELVMVYNAYGLVGLKDYFDALIIINQNYLEIIF